jgi:hypothetical protein
MKAAMSWKGFIAKAKEFDSAWSLLQWPYLLITSLVPSAIMSIIASKISWFWGAYGLLGVGILAIVVWLVSSAAFYLTALAWHGWKIPRSMLSARDTVSLVDRRVPYVPLYEAAQRAFDSNIVAPSNTPLAAFVRGLERNCSEDIIAWYCNYLRNRIDIYGCRVPSTKVEKFVQPGYDFRIEDSVVIATERSGQGRWEHLTVLESDLLSVIGAIDGQRHTISRDT